ncbi:hypothetical protein SH528x_003758 [Novipirellula sp. SH528]|uniref:hypothetical protein n=1 Tax=Novipirellula sp. SH528 TaxID=3454466 RepID=UPI003FA1319A
MLVRFKSAVSPAVIPLFMAIAACWGSDVQAQCSGGRGGGGPASGNIATVSPQSVTPFNSFAAIQSVTAQRQMYQMRTQLAQLQQQQQQQMLVMRQNAYRQQQQTQVEREQELLAQRQERAEQKREKRAQRLAARVAERQSMTLAAKQQKVDPFASTHLTSTY